MVVQKTKPPTPYPRNENSKKRVNIKRLLPPDHHQIFILLLSYDVYTRSRLWEYAEKHPIRIA